MTDNQAIDTGQATTASEQDNSAPPAGAATTRPYKAYDIEQPQKRSSLITFYYADGMISLIQKSHLIEIILTSHQNLSLVFTNCSITLTGRHLDHLIELFRNDQILSLHCFNSRLHDRPQENQIIINNIVRRTPKEISAVEKGK